MSKKILLTLKLPPPFGGGEIQAQVLSKLLADNKSYKILNFTRSSTNKSKQGNFTLANLFYGNFIILKICFSLVHIHPEKIYLSIPKDKFAFLRDSIVILFSYFLKVKVYGELPGMSFNFLNSPPSILHKYSLFVLRKLHSIRFLGNNIKENNAFIKIHNPVVFSNGVDIPVDHSVSEAIIYNKQLKLLYVGKISRQKGFAIIINALKLCLENKISFVFNVVGEWASVVEQEELEEIIHEYALEKYIMFHGLQVGNNKWSIFIDNCILVHPTFWDGQPLSILEAMGLGLAIISSDIGAIPETVQNGENGIILMHNDAFELFDSIKLFDENRDYLLQVSKANKLRFQREYTYMRFLENFNNWMIN